MTAIDGFVIIAGGSNLEGSASRQVLIFDPATRRIRTLGILPAPTTHAAAAPLRGIVYLFGGRGGRVNSISSRIIGIDRRRRRVRAAGRLRSPRADLAAVTVVGSILVLGGRDTDSFRPTVGTVQPIAPPLRRRPRPRRR